MTRGAVFPRTIERPPSGTARPLRWVTYVAMYNLGVLYDFGRGFPEDNEEAVRWYKMSAEHGYSQAQTNLGLMYRTGEGVTKDFKKGAEYYLLAAEQGDPKGQRQYGYVLFIGEGVRRNRIEALKWFHVGHGSGGQADARCHQG